jgi:hypothetical protein
VAPVLPPLFRDEYPEYLDDALCGLDYPVINSKNSSSLSRGGKEMKKLGEGMIKVNVQTEHWIHVIEIDANEYRQ